MASALFKSLKRMAAVFISMSITAANVSAVNAEEVTRYEAEKQYTGGWAAVGEYADASGGAAVERIGGTNTDIGTVVFKVWASVAGEHTVKVAYRSERNSHFYIRVNYSAWDTANDTYVAVSGSEEFQTVTVTEYLNSGWNDIKIYSTKGIINGTDYRIAVDYIEINDTAYEPSGIISGSEAAVSGGYERTVYKAEGESVIAGLAGDSKAEFTVQCETDGAYKLTVWYSAWDFRALDIAVDGEYADTLYCPITGEDYNIEAITTTLNLDTGEHLITFSNKYSNAPDIDKIKLEYIGDMTEAESGESAAAEFGNGIFNIRYDLETGRADYYQNGVLRVHDFEAAVKIEGVAEIGADTINTAVKSSDYSVHTLTTADISDGLGRGVVYTVVSTGENLPDMYQSFYVYDELEYALIDVRLSSEEKISTNFMAPICASGADAVGIDAKETDAVGIDAIDDNAVDIGAAEDMRVLFVPFSNDNFVTYNAEDTDGEHTSYFVSAVFDNNSGSAVVAGSVEHDTWKTGVRVWTEGGDVTFFGAFCGIWSEEYTYDFLPHGSISGTTVGSAKMFLGYFDDWRDGLEEYGAANRKMTGILAWNGGSIFGYNSWNAQGTGLNLSDTFAAVDEIAALRDNGFCDENGTAWLNLDSYYDNLEGHDSDVNGVDDLQDFVNYAKENGLKAGIYSARLITWDNDLYNWGVRGNAVVDKYGNPAAPAKADSRYGTVINCFSVDPTSETTRRNIKEFTEKYTAMGFEYFKLDFLNFSALEGVFADENITTGMQAYNSVCKTLAEYVDTDHVFISYSIAPLFPSQYAHSRRISCDVGAESGGDYLSEAKYMLNALEYGWWQSGTLYEYTDPDMVTFYAPPLSVFMSYAKAYARGKYTSAVIAGGLVLLSNNYSTNSVRTVTEYAATNEAVNEVARIGKAFRPAAASLALETNYKDSVDAPQNVYYLEYGGYTYCAVFNFGSSSDGETVDLASIGLDPNTEYEYTELWEGGTGTLTGDIFTTPDIAAYSAAIYKINSGAGLDDDTGDDDSGSGDVSELIITAGMLYRVGGKVCVDVTVENECNIDAELFAAAYAGGELTGIYCEGIEDGTSMRTVRLDGAGCDEIKLFVWQSGSMVPLCEAVEIEL